MGLMLRCSRRELLRGAAMGAVAVAAGPGMPGMAGDMALHDLGVLQAVAGLTGGAFGAVDLAEALLERSARLNELGAFITQDSGQVLADAASADEGRDQAGLLPGLPLAVMDNIDSAGLATTAGTPALADWRPSRDASVLAGLRMAGAIVLGKTNMHELGFGVTGNNPTFGAARNPYAPDLIAGGGTAAAVAARLTPAGLATDTAGSCRISAALCGCVGFRPTLGRYPRDGVLSLSSSRGTVALIARSVADVAFLDPLCAGLTYKPAEVELDGLRLGVPRTFFYDDLDPGLADVVEAALERLRRAGAVLIEDDLDDVGRLNEAASLPILLFEALRELAAYFYRHGSRMSVLDILESMASPVERAVLTAQSGDQAIDAAAYRAALVVYRSRLQAAYFAWFRANDVAAMVVPTTPLPARPIGQDDAVMLNGVRVPTFATYIRNTDPPATAGLPCLTVPAGLTAAGLPIGLEFVAPGGKDAVLLALGASFEKLADFLPSPTL